MNFPFYELTNNIGQNLSDVHILNYIISLDHLNSKQHVTNLYWAEWKETSGTWPECIYNSQ